MIRQPRTDFLIKRSGTDFVRVASFREYAPNEMVLAFDGFTSGAPMLAFEYDDRIISRDEMTALRINYSAANPVRRNVDHFTVHCERHDFASGEFHLRATYGSQPIHNVSIPPPVNRFSEVFLDFVVIPDDLSKYESFSEKLTERDVILSTENNSLVVIRGRFAGSEFDLESMVLSEEQQLGRTVFPAATLSGGTIKGIFTWYSISPPPEALTNRPAGTYVLLRFPSAPTTYLVKTFVFS